MANEKSYNLVVPLAGRGQRMLDAGLTGPKPMLFAGDRRIIEWSMQAIDYSDCDITFVVRQDHALNYGFDDFLKYRYPGCRIVLAHERTGGAVDSVLLAQEWIDNAKPLIVYCPDTYFEPQFKPSERFFAFDGALLTFKANSPNYSYVEVDSWGMVLRVAEKLVISQWANVGVYCFRSGKLFCRQALTNPDSKGERYIAPLYNALVPYVRYHPVERIYIMGTPQERLFFEERCFRYLTQRRFAVCCDHSGYETKERFLVACRASSLNVVDCGTFGTRDCDYTTPVKEACRFVQQGYFGIGFCRSGQGVNLAAQANGAHSVLVRDLEDVELGIRHNAANFFAVAVGKHTLDFDVTIKTLLKTKFDGGRHQNRLMEV